MKEKNKFNSEVAINDYAKTFVDKELKDFLNMQNLNKNNKGGLGNLIQEEIFNIPPNNLSTPDFSYYGLDLELKVTPMKKLKTKDSYSAKERLVLGMIDYNKIVEEPDFFSSHLFMKTKKIQIITYLDDSEQDMENWKITSVYMLNLKNLPKNEIETIAEDYQIIRNKIMAGKAHEISESDTSILAACTKGSTREKSFKKQPFSKQKAKARAFSLKPSYMTTLFYRNLQIEDYIQDSQQIETGRTYINKLLEYINNNLINENVYNYYTNILKKSVIPKQMNNIVINAMLEKFDSNYKNKLNKFGYKIRTMTINENNKFQESFPLSNSLDNYDMQNPNYTFENSEVYQQLVLTKYIIIPVKKMHSDIKNSFISQVFDFFIDENQNLFLDLKKVWKQAKQNYMHPQIKKIKFDNNGLKYHEIKFPNLKENLGFHIRPKARNNKDRYLIGQQNFSIVKQTFWVNKNVIDDYYSKITKEKNNF